MTRETFNDEFVKELKTGLESAPKSTSKMSKADVLRQLTPTLRMLREERDYTLEALVALLAEKGLKVKVSTLQGALKKKGGTKKTKTTAGDPPGALALPPAAVQQKLNGSRHVEAPSKTKAA